jgi:flagellar motor switch protein FliM
MRNILSQDEVDSLLDGISTGKVETQTAIPERDEKVLVYDFRTQEGHPNIRMPTLDMINERFVGALRADLSTATRSVVDVNISSTESVKFGEFCRSLPLPTSLNIFKVEPLMGFSLLVLEGPLVFSFVDTFFGGKSVSSVKLEGRSFTSIEKKIIEKIVEIVLNAFQQAWSDVYRIKTIFVRSEVDPQFTTFAAPSDIIIVIRLTVDLENASGTMTICIPHSLIEPIKDRLMVRFRGERLEVDERWRRHIETRIKEVTLNVSCTLGVTKITGRELLDMKVNDVVLLDQKMQNPLIVSVEGNPTFMAYPGAYNKRKAVRIERKLAKE